MGRLKVAKVNDIFWHFFFALRKKRNIYLTLNECHYREEKSFIKIHALPLHSNNTFWPQNSIERRTNVPCKLARASFHFKKSSLSCCHYRGKRN